MFSLPLPHDTTNAAYIMRGLMPPAPPSMRNATCKNLAQFLKNNPARFGLVLALMPAPLFATAIIPMPLR